MTDLQDRIAALTPEKRALLEARVAELAAARAPAPEERIKPRDPTQPTPLAFQQEREWAIAHFRPANNIPGAFRVEGSLDPELLSRVLTEVTSRHEILRSTIELCDDGTRMQVAHPLTPVPARSSTCPALHQGSSARRCCGAGKTRWCGRSIPGRRSGCGPLFCGWPRTTTSC